MTRTCIASRATATSTASQVVDGVAKLAAGYRYVEGNGRREVIRTFRLLALASLLAGCASLGGLPAPGERDFARIQDGMTRDDTRRLLDAGIDAVLIGETFMRAQNIGEKVREVMGVMDFSI